MQCGYKDKCDITVFYTEKQCQDVLEGEYSKDAIHWTAIRFTFEKLKLHDSVFQSNLN